MSKYHISVREFIEEMRNSNIDYVDFSGAFMEELHKADKKFSLLREIVDIRKYPKDAHRSFLKDRLWGLPISVKDCICVKDVTSAAGSKILYNYIPPFDATVVSRVKAQGGIVCGKTNQDEFGFGTFSTNSGFGVPKNPHDETRSCGGSSGGAGGLVAAMNMPHIALGQSTGGSISAPAAFCGVTSITPTYGLVSRYGLIDYANSLDKIGILAKNVYDTALGLSMIAGHDDRDSTSLNTNIIAPRKPDSNLLYKDYTGSLNRKDLKGMKIGIPKEYFENIDKKVEKAVRAAIDNARSLGASVSEFSLPTTKFSIAAYYIIATSEASTNLAKYCGMRYGLHSDLEGNFNEYFSKVRTAGFGEEAKRRIMLGTFCRMSGYRDAYYVKAMKVRTLIIQDFKKAFNRFDAIMAPTMPIIAPKFSEIKKLTPMENYQMDVLTCPANLAGIPHLSMPLNANTTASGKSRSSSLYNKDNMPIGLHLLGDHLQEGKLFEIAGVLEGKV